jgi:hypothetical protein
VLPIALLVIAPCAVVAFVLAMQGRLSLSSRGDPAVQPSAPTSVSSATTPASMTPAASESAPVSTLAAVASVAPARSASGRRGARHVRVVSARNTGDAAWRSWAERHRQRIESCAATQVCVAHVSLHVTKSSGKVSTTVNATPGDTTCAVQPALHACLTDLTNTKESTPGPDVCSDPTECHAEVLLAFE